MKKYILIALSLIIIGVFFIYKYNKEDLKFRCTNASFHYVAICMERGDLYPQEQYDFYYNIAANNPPISILTNNDFYYGFDLAEKNCGHHSEPKPCNEHDKNVIRDFAEKCTFSTNKNLWCTHNYFGRAIPNKKNVAKFLEIVQNDIKKMKKNMAQ